MEGDLTLLRPLWLLLLPLAWWLWRRPVAPPALLAPLAMRYPPLADAVVETGETAASQVVPGPRGGWRGRLLAAAVACAVMALVQPAWLGKPLEAGERGEPVDLVLVVGTAITMGLRDYIVDGERVDRMTLTRRLLDRFLADYSGRRVGLVVLGDPPALWLPLTPDRAVVRHAVGRIRTTLGGRLTDIGAALELVAERFGDRQGAVVVMFSDASLQVGRIPPVAGAEALARAGLTLYTVAMGSADPAAGEEGAGRLIYRPVDLELLREVARAGGGEMFHAVDGQRLRAALETIEARHRRPLPGADAGRRVRALYPWPLGAALALVLAALAGLRPPRSWRRTGP